MRLLLAKAAPVSLLSLLGNSLLTVRGVARLHGRMSNVRMVRKQSIYRNRIEMLQGTLDLLMLQTLQWGPRHGYGISQAIRSGSGEVLRADTGSIYPALHRLERAKCIAAEWKTPENQQRVKVDRLTTAGKKQLISERSRWERLVIAIGGILGHEQS